MTITQKKSTEFITKIFTYAFIAGVVLGLWFVFVAPNNLLAFKSTILIMVYLLYIFLWIIQTQTIKSLFLIYLCYTFLTNAGQLILLILNIDVLGYVDVVALYNDTLLSQTINYQVLCTVLMTTFALIAHEIHSVRKDEKNFFLQQTDITESDYISTNDIIFVFTGVLYFLANLVQLATRVNMSYLDAFNSGEAEAVPLILAFVFYITMYKSCFLHRGKQDKFKSVILIVNVFVGISSLLFGSRNVLIPLVFGMMFIWKFDCKKTSLNKKLKMVLLVFLGIYLIGSFVNLRHYSLSELNFSVIVDALFGAGISEQLITLISEMGMSLRVLATTMFAIDTGVVEGEQTFLYTALKGIVPQVELLDAVGIYEPERWSLSYWITETYGQNAGWGYSMYAEAYYNFKWFGCIFMATFGYVYSLLECKIEKWYINGRTVMASAWLFLATYLIFIARADSLLITSRLRYIIYLSIVCLLLRNKVKLSKSKFKL